MFALCRLIALTTALAAPPAPPTPGVVFFAPKDPAAAVAELAKIRADGYGLVKMASWCWTLPRPGSDLERTARAVLDWCDTHEMRFVLLQNIQFGSKGEGGGLDDAVSDPLRAGRYLSDWLRVLHGHPCVTGVVLGNEVGPVVGDPRHDPRWWAGLLDDLRARHGTIAALNAAWGTQFTDFAAVTPPAPGAPGQVDVQRYATQVFDRFYGALFEQFCLPALGPKLYGAKCAGDPLLQRALDHATCVCWDDVLADYPQWRVKALGDVAARTGKPAFNAELHLYHEGYVYGGSAAKSRYRYLLAALDREQFNASFAWGQWSKSAAPIHQATPAILAQMARLAPALGRLAAAEAEFQVLLSDPTAADDAVAQALYTQAAGLGRPWRYVCPQDLSALTAGDLVLPAGTRLDLAQWQALAGAPPALRLIALEPVALADAYGRPLPAALAEPLAQRLRHAGALAEVLPPTVGAPYAEPATVSYLDWNPKRGHFHYPLTYPKLEARRAKTEQGWLVAIINHATDGPAVSAPLPWLSPEVTAVRELPDETFVARDQTQSFGPLAVRVWRYETR
jgi:hypothetical protein